MLEENRFCIDKYVYNLKKPPPNQKATEDIKESGSDKKQLEKLNKDTLDKFFRPRINSVDLQQISEVEIQNKEETINMIATERNRTENYYDKIRND